MQMPPAVAELKKQVKSVRIRSKKTNAMLVTHIDECAKMQRWVLRGVAGILFWIMTHSPEASAVADKILPLIVSAK